MRINPFIICDVAEQSRFRQMARYDEWRAALAVLGVDAETARAYDDCARAYAATTVYPNSDVIEYCRQLALDTLARGDAMPSTPEAAIAHDNARRTAHALEGVDRLRGRF